MEIPKFNNRTGPNKVRIEWKMPKINNRKFRIRLYRVENFFEINNRTYTIIRKVRVTKYSESY